MAAAELDRALAEVRAAMAARAEVYARFTALGRELAVAEQELADARAPVARPATSSRWRRRRPDAGSAVEVDVTAVLERVAELRTERSLLDAAYRAVDDPSARHAELVEQKCRLLADDPGPVGHDMRRLDDTLAKLATDHGRLEAVIGTGEAAQAAAEELREEILEAERDRKRSQMLAGTAGIGGLARVGAHVARSAVDAAVEQAIDGVERFDASLCDLGMAPVGRPATCALRTLAAAGALREAVVEQLGDVRRRFVANNADIARLELERRTSAEAARPSPG